MPPRRTLTVAERGTPGFLGVGELASTRNLARELNPGIPTGGPLAPITGNPLTIGADTLETGTGSIFGAGLGEGDFRTSIQQLLDPSLTQEQSLAARQLARGAGARGLIGGAVTGAQQRQEQSFLAGNRLQALQDVSGEVSTRLGRFQEAVNPLFELVGGSGRLAQQPRSVIGRLNFQADLARGLLESDAGVEAAFSGLQSLGRGDIVQAALFGQLGNAAQGLRGGDLDLTGENAALLGALNTFLDPRLSAAQRGEGTNTGIGRRAPVEVGQELDRALNKLRGGAALTGFFTEQLGGLSSRFDELQTLGLGLAGESAQRDPQAVLGADFGQFRDLFGSVGLLDQPRGPADRGTGIDDFLESSRRFQDLLAPSVRAQPIL